MTMPDERLRELLESHLGPEKGSRKGSVLYSGLDTIKAGGLYVLGFNPGGKPQDTDDSILGFRSHDGPWSAYTHDCWQDTCAGTVENCEHMDDEGRIRKEFLSRHQRNIEPLFNAMGKLPEQCFCANYILARSQSVKALQSDTYGVSLEEWEIACWPIHQALLDIVRPSWIISLGYGPNSSAYGRLKKRAGDIGPEAPVVDGAKDAWAYKAQLDLGPQRDALTVQVLGVTHPSYRPIGVSLAQAIARDVAQPT